MEFLLSTVQSGAGAVTELVGSRWQSRGDGEGKELLPSADRAVDKAGIPLKTQVEEAAEHVNIDTGQQGRILIEWTL